MEASESNGPIIPTTLNSITSSAPLWPTIDGPLGLTGEESLSYARRFYQFGFALLPLLWAINCFYFWPVLRHSLSFLRLRRYVLGSAVGFAVLAVLLSSWALTFSIGAEHSFDSVWDKLVMYNVGDRLGLELECPLSQFTCLKTHFRSTVFH